MGLTVRYRHCKALKYCDRGIREFLKQRGLSFPEFVKNGYPVEIAESWDDLMVRRLVEYARKEGLNNG